MDQTQTDTKTRTRRRRAGVVAVAVAGLALLAACGTPSSNKMEEATALRLAGSGGTAACTLNAGTDTATLKTFSGYCTIAGVQWPTSSTYRGSGSSKSASVVVYKPAGAAGIGSRLACNWQGWGDTTGNFPAQCAVG